MTIEGDRQLSNFVPDRLPEFVRVDHPTLVAFLSAYYEWLGLRRNSGKILSPLEMNDIPDIDTTLDQFVDHFKSEYLLNFPETLAVNKTTDEPVDPRRLIKNIKQFYLAKGTEKSYEFLFRILYDASVEFYYPKKDIMRLSSGRWTQNNYLRISNSLGDQIYEAAGNNIVQYDSGGNIVATARVIDVTVYQIGNFPVAELLITGRNGTFRTGNLGIDFNSGAADFHEVTVYSVVSSVTINNAGSDYQIGDRIKFVANGDSGQRGTGTVVEVNSTGGIRKINIDDFGINYTKAPTIAINSVRGSGFNGTVTVGSLCQSAGYYANNDGRLSTNKVLQDNHFYQNWSYVLKSEVVIDRYREVIRRLVHPIGTGMFGSVLIKRCAKEDLDNSSALMSFRIPIIGHYVPYTFKTFDDLSVWFLSGVTGGGLTAAGYSPDTHDILIQGSGNGLAVIGNPISNNISFVTATTGILSQSGFPNADPFWIVYPHANKMVERGYHIAKIWNTQIDDFVSTDGGWGEWSYRRENGLTAMRDWESDLRSTIGPHAPLYTEPYDFKYALLEYDETSEFRKITARAFFNMPQGQHFDCRDENIVNVALPQFSPISPIAGQVMSNLPLPANTLRSDYEFFRRAIVQFGITHEENLAYYKAKEIRIYLDNVLKATVGINTRKVSINGIKDGRHTLKMEMYDDQQRLIGGTQKIVPFAYEFSYLMEAEAL